MLVHFRLIVSLIARPRWKWMHLISRDEVLRRQLSCQSRHDPPTTSLWGPFGWNWRRDPGPGRQHRDQRHVILIRDSRFLGEIQRQVVSLVSGRQVSLAVHREGDSITAASLTISVIAILIVGVIAWNVFSGKEDWERLRRRFRRGGST